MSEPLAPSTPSRPRWLLVGGLAIALVAGFGLLRSLRRPVAPTPAVAGSAAPDFRLASLDGRQLGPADFAGKVVLIDFWATWCGPCHLQADILKEIYPALKDKGVVFLAVSVGEEEKTVRDFVAESPFPYPVLIDPKDEISGRFDVAALPTVMIVDKSSHLAFRQDGVSDRESLLQALKAAGAG